MDTSSQLLTTSEAAKRLGVSIKALRLYEQHGLMTPGRTAAGYRVFAPAEMVRATQIVALRTLGLSLAQVARVLDGDPQCLDSALATHEAQLEDAIRQAVGRIDRSRRLRADLARGQMPGDADLTGMLQVRTDLSVTFKLPWPWGGELFELGDIRPLNFIIGPLGSGKTRFAMCLAEALPNAVFLGLERLNDGATATVAKVNSDSTLKSKVDAARAWLAEEGATDSAALKALLGGLEAEGRGAVVVDMVEQGLDHATQQALISYLRHRATVGGRPLFLMTRSSVILDLDATGSEEAIILCPANHSPPTRIAPYRGAPGYEAVATCLAAPAVRARVTAACALSPHAHRNGLPPVTATVAPET
jgi:DNA-binding transcriptional MerR regulator